MSRALDLLRAAAATSSITAAAARCGISRAAASHLLSGTYRVSTAHLEAKILAALGAPKVSCPTRGTITTDACATHRAAPMPTSSPMALSRWRACQTCLQPPKQPS
jgi:hypothetical protein